MRGRSLLQSSIRPGPPGAPIEDWLQCNNMDTILDAADDLMARLKKFDVVYQVRSDF